MRHNRLVLTAALVSAMGLLALSAPAARAGGQAPSRLAPATGRVVAVKTNHGEIHIELFRDKAPKTVESFLGYVARGHYAGTLFHRVIPNFMIQGGGMDASLRQKPTAKPVQNEADNGLRNLRGTVAMARTANPHSATSQFFVNLKWNSFLDHSAKTTAGWGYCVFGRVIKGMDVVDNIAKVATSTKGPHQNVPNAPVVIESVRVLK
jgi:cyclophilin family peptidyl-prolyl cis-trans isomerase